MKKIAFFLGVLCFAQFVIEYSLNNQLTEIKHQLGASQNELVTAWGALNQSQGHPVNMEEVISLYMKWENTKK